MKTYYTLNEYDLDFLEGTVLNEAGHAIVFDNEKDAFDFAAWMLDGHADDEHLPLINIHAWDGNPEPMLNAGAPDDDIPTYEVGYVEYRDPDVHIVMDSAENDRGLWDRMKVFKARVAV